ncbi:hypothetical protein BC938DRAFT_475381 [Jimgerdemannia flammicorona]|uniref:Uncharacterized protein n=1 Tax=Jimgerdemannia flammicorona TaxID=994334 RepID=A0A433QRR1_9FUNG|nr:hypothetical protein BC938DRAFT_475381 [Jimgerdemannia flammicorona]
MNDKARLFRYKATYEEYGMPSDPNKKAGLEPSQGDPSYLREFRSFSLSCNNFRKIRNEQPNHQNTAYIPQSEHAKAYPNQPTPHKSNSIEQRTSKNLVTSSLVTVLPESLKVCRKDLTCSAILL